MVPNEGSAYIFTIAFNRAFKFIVMPSMECEDFEKKVWFKPNKKRSIIAETGINFLSIALNI
jgi:hypothetical protein